MCAYRRAGWNLLRSAEKQRDRGGRDLGDVPVTTLKQDTLKFIVSSQQILYFPLVRLLAEG